MTRILDGVELEFESQMAASRELKLTQTYISKMCRGDASTHKGYKARFKDETNDEASSTN